MWAYEKSYAGAVKIGVPPKVSVEGCVGVRSVGGSNQSSITDYKHIRTEGFYEGFKMAGEHVVMENCVAMYCVYGYTFGNFAWGAGSNHPITLINCCDERNVNFPLFVANGEYGNSSKTGRQAIDFINFNLERIQYCTPGKVLGKYAEEVNKGVFYGKIEYTIQDEFGTYGNTQKMPFWETDGSGVNMISENQAHKLRGTTSERLTYAPNYNQQYFDTDLNKLLIYNGHDWTDCNGNVIK